MEETKQPVDELKEERKRARKEKWRMAAAEKAYAVGAWLERNKELVVTVVPVVTGLTVGIVKLGRTRKQKELKELYCYDRSAGHYWRLRRKLSNREWMEVQFRRSTGEKLGDILTDMRVLK